MCTGGGIVIDPIGKIEAYYAWGLDIASSNRARAYALWKGLKIAKGVAMQSIKVLRDSGTIINHIVKNLELGNNPLDSIMD
jgi:ribonuclease HI